MVKRKTITLDENLDAEVAKLEEADIEDVLDAEVTRVPTAPTLPVPKPKRTRCYNCGEEFEGTSTAHFLEKHAP